MSSGSTEIGRFKRLGRLHAVTFNVQLCHAAQTALFYSRGTVLPEMSGRPFVSLQALASLDLGP